MKILHIVFGLLVVLLLSAILAAQIYMINDIQTVTNGRTLRVYIDDVDPNITSELPVEIKEVSSLITSPLPVHIEPQ